MENYQTKTPLINAIPFKWLHRRDAVELSNLRIINDSKENKRKEKLKENRLAHGVEWRHVDKKENK